MAPGLARRGRQFPFVHGGTKPSPPSPPTAQRGVCAPGPGAAMGKQALPLHSSNNTRLRAGELPRRRLAALTAGSTAAVTRGAKRGRLPRVGLGQSSGAKAPWGHDTHDKPRQAGTKAGSRAVKSRGRARQVALPRRARPSQSRVDSHLICKPSRLLRQRRRESGQIRYSLAAVSGAATLHTRDQARPEQPGRTPIRSQVCQR